METKTKTMIGMSVGYAVGDLVNMLFGLDSFMSFTGIFVSAAFAIAGIIIAFKYF